MNEEVAQRIRLHLALQNESQAWLATELGWTAQRLSQRMTGKVAFSFTDVARIAAAFGRSLPDFLAGDLAAVAS